MSFRLGLALGLAAGVVVGLATAPRPGRETRRRLSGRPLDPSIFQGNGQGAAAPEIPTVYQTASEDGEPPTFYRSESEEDA